MMEMPPTATSGALLPPTGNPLPNIANATAGSPLGEPFRQSLQLASEASNPATTAVGWLTTPAAARATRPTVADFVKASGTDFATAAELVYGVAGSNEDRRNWAAIMSDPDPMTAARLATRAMYGDASTGLSPLAPYLRPENTADRRGNFALMDERRPNGDLRTQHVMLVDANGMLLRSAGIDGPTIQRNAWLFGLDAQDAASLAPAAQAHSQLALALQEAGALESVRRTVLQDRAPIAAPPGPEAGIPTTAPALTAQSALDVVNAQEGAAGPTTMAANLPATLPDAATAPELADLPPLSTLDMLRLRGADITSAPAGTEIPAVASLLEANTDALVNGLMDEFVKG